MQALTLQLSLASLLFFLPGLAHFRSVANTNQAKDAAAIRAHIESIFQAFIEGDIEKIHAPHSDDWRGLLEGTRPPIKGIDEYMRANGIEWPRPADAPKRTPYYPAATRYQVSDFDVHFYSPELAVANFLGGFERDINNTTVTLRRFRSRLMICVPGLRAPVAWYQSIGFTSLDNGERRGPK